MRCAVCPGLGLAVLLTGLVACGSDGAATNPSAEGGTGGDTLPPPAAGASAGTPAQSAAGARAAGSGGAGVSGAGAGASTSQAGSGLGGVGASGAGSAAGGAGDAGGGASVAGAGAVAGAGGAGAAGSLATDVTTFAKDLNGLFIDVPCAPATPTPLAMMATCMHPANTQHIEKKVTFGGEPNKTYSVVLRVRGVWEPTKIDGGMHPDSKVPFTIGGMIPPGSASSDAINYQQYSIAVSAPKQTFWLNDHQYVAHDIHKEDYQATIQVSGGAMIVVAMNDGNDHEIANWTKDFFEGLPPYDTKPSLGQMLRLDVVSVMAQ
jgi:hypothetical protein